eukprot:5405797-Amphidinium_carterae.1
MDDDSAAPLPTPATLETQTLLDILPYEQRSTKVEMEAGQDMEAWRVEQEMHEMVDAHLALVSK